MTAFLYRHFNTDGVLLYIGESLSFTNRTKQHCKDAKWFKEITSITIEQYKSKEDVISAEINAIQKEKPLYNKRHTKPKKAPTVKRIVKKAEGTKAAVKLERYMHTHLISDMKMAEKLGVTRQSVHGWRSGKIPKDSMKKKIQLVTGGKVPLLSWFE